MNNIVLLYVDMIGKGIFTLEQVPLAFRRQVEEELNKGK